jgi:hypothetical protein
MHFFEGLIFDTHLICERANRIFRKLGFMWLSNHVMIQ